MNILGFTPLHNSSSCLLENGELKFFIEEERLTRKKHDGGVFKSFIDVLQNYSVDIISWGSTTIYFPINTVDNSIPYFAVIASKFSKSYQSAIDFSKNGHHLTHASHTFYNSGFKEAIGVVIDGLGSEVKNKNNAHETETIFKCSYPHSFNVLYKNINVDLLEVKLSQSYEAVTMHLGWCRNEAGKTMGLAPYGKYNPNLPTFFYRNHPNPDIFYVDNSKTTHLPLQDRSFLNEEKYPQLKLQRDPREWHYDESKITDLEKDIAWKIQNDTQQVVGDYIEKAIQETGLKQVCCAGGYFLNCVTNYYLLKRFPDIEFYFEPIAGDAGTAIGAAKLVWHNETHDTTIRPLKSLYLGKQYSKKELLDSINKFIKLP